MAERLIDLPDGNYAQVTGNLNFTITDNGQWLTATTSSAATQIDAAGSGEDVMIYNSGAAVVHVKAGVAGVTATTDSMPVLPGEKGAYYKGNATHLAVLAASGSIQVWVNAGEGA